MMTMMTMSAGNGAARKKVDVTIALTSTCTQIFCAGA
jgi:hypothetical protein